MTHKLKEKRIAITESWQLGPFLSKMLETSNRFQSGHVGNRKNVKLKIGLYSKSDEGGS